MRDGIEMENTRRSIHNNVHGTCPVMEVADGKLDSISKHTVLFLEVTMSLSGR